ncbi:MAG: Lrp/AsnC ligand binding domain-containing protein [Nitrososphaerota archaeon]
MRSQRMIKAFVLGVVGSRSELVSSLNAIRNLPNVEEAYLLWGTYDVIAKVVVPSLEDLNSVLDGLYRSGVVDSNTLIVNPGGLSLEKPESRSKRKCAYTFIKIRRPAAPRLWGRFLSEIDAVMEAYEIFGMYDVIVAVSEDVRADFFDSYFRKLWILTEINMNNTTTMFTVEV